MVVGAAIQRFGLALTVVGATLELSAGLRNHTVGILGYGRLSLGLGVLVSLVGLAVVFRESRGSH